jgi:hypothetical protein
MGNPMLVGMAIGAGAGALTSKDPLKGALMGGAMGAGAGGLGGAMIGAGGAGAGGAFGAGGLGSVGTSGFTALPSASGATTGSSLGGMFSNMSMPSTITGIGKDISAVNTFMNQNPTTSQIGMGLAKDLLQQDPTQMAPAGQIQRGPIGQVDYMSLLNPQNQTVIRPQQISLLG